MTSHDIEEFDYDEENVNNKKLNQKQLQNHIINLIIYYFFFLNLFRKPHDVILDILCVGMVWYGYTEWNKLLVSGIIITIVPLFYAGV